MFNSCFLFRRHQWFKLFIFCSFLLWNLFTFVCLCKNTKFDYDWKLISFILECHLVFSFIYILHVWYFLLFFYFFVCVNWILHVCFLPSPYHTQFPFHFPYLIRSTLSNILSTNLCVQTWNGHMKFVRNITKHPKCMAAAAAIARKTSTWRWQKKTFNSNENLKINKQSISFVEALSKWLSWTGM